MTKKNEEKMSKLEDTVLDATIRLLEMAFEMWISEYFKPLFHRMTRTFTHYRLGEKYDSKIIFEQLLAINKGDHASLLRDMEAYRQTLFDELPKKFAELKNKA